MIYPKSSNALLLRSMDVRTELFANALPKPLCPFPRRVLLKVSASLLAGFSLL